MFNKKLFAILITTISVASLSMAQRTLFVSSTGGNWSDDTTWKTGKSTGDDTTAPTADETPIGLRADERSGNLIFDVDATTSSVSGWGKNQNYFINEGKTWTIKGTTSSSQNSGYNIASVTTNISGSGTLQGFNLGSGFVNSIAVYGGNGGKLNISSKASVDGVYFSDNSVLAGKTVVSFTGNLNGTQSNYTNKDGTAIDCLYKFNIRGKVGVETVVEMKGTTIVGDIHLTNNAKLIIDTDSFTSKGQWKVIEVTKSEVELVGGKIVNGETVPYVFGSKIRLNGNATLTLTGADAYRNFTNVLFDYGLTNTINVNGKTDLNGFCLYEKSTYAEGDKTLRIVLGDVAEGDNYVLKLNRLVDEPGNNSCLKDDSLTETIGGVAVDDLWVEFVNFDNGKVKLTKNLATDADWKQIKADGWENFRLENGYIVADRVAVPEPAEWAIIFGAIALAFVAYRRK